MLTMQIASGRSSESVRGHDMEQAMIEGAHPMSTYSLAVSKQLATVFRNGLKILLEVEYQDARLDPTAPCKR